MHIGIGIDFGTTNSSAALFDGERVRYLPLDPSNGDPVMPTALYLSRAGRAYVGLEAIERYMQDNEGRTIELRPEVVGAIETVVAGTSDTNTNIQRFGGAIHDSFDVHAWTDQGLPGRLFRGVKRWLGSRTLDRVRVFERGYRIVALATPVLNHIRESVREATDSPATMCVGRPVRYEGRGEDTNDIAVRRMTEACGHAGIRPMALVAEPIGAATSYLHDHPIADGEVALAFDFGGGTLDLSVLESRGGELVVRATHGVPVGGDEVDRRIYRDRVFPALGEGLRVRMPGVAEWKEETFAFEPYGDRLLNWPLAYELNQPHLLEAIAHGMQSSEAAGRKLGRLFDLIRFNRSYSVFQAIERAKIALSEQPTARIEVDEVDLSIELTRGDLTRITAPIFELAAEAIDRVLTAAELDPGEVAVVVRTGGSSRLAGAQELLETRFPDRVVEHDPFTSIAAGLAIASWRQQA